MVYHQMAQRTPIVFDTGCSVSITPFQGDFVGIIQPCKVSHINGVGNTTHKIAGVGVVEWSIYDANGEEFVIQTAAYYVPSSDIRLFSPQTYST